jgi:prepilin-type processing-associated H-X9-DG protein
VQSNCSATQSCGISRDVTNKFWTDGTYRSKYARHLGGSNIGFLDGHAAWWAADAIIAGAGNRHNPNPQPGPLIFSDAPTPPQPPPGAPALPLGGVNCQCLPQGM